MKKEENLEWAVPRDALNANDFTDYPSYPATYEEVHNSFIKDLRMKIADECSMLIRNELDIFQGPLDEGGYNGICKKADCLTNIMKIIRGDK